MNPPKNPPKNSPNNPLQTKYIIQVSSNEDVFKDLQKIARSSNPYFVKALHGYQGTATQISENVIQVEMYGILPDNWPVQVFQNLMPNSLEHLSILLKNSDGSLSYN
jgi:hypothetical protein